MKVYVTVRKGVYRHNIFGVFKSKEAAISVAKEKIEQEADHYHDCVICEFEVDTPVNDGVLVASLVWNKSEKRVDVFDAEVKP